MTAKSKSSFDLLIIGGGIGGCVLAAEAAGRGLSVAVVEKRPYLGREVSAYNHCFAVSDQDDNAFRRCPGYLQKLFQLHGGGELVAPEGLLRQQLQKTMEDAGVKLLFEAEAVALSHSSGKPSGLLLACAGSGLNWLPGAVVADATERLNLLRSLAGRPNVGEGGTIAHASFELDRIAGAFALQEKLAEGGLLSLCEELKLIPGSLKAHQTIRNDALLFEYAFAYESRGRLFAERSSLDAEGRKRSFEVAARLRSAIPELNGANLCHAAYECHFEKPDEKPLSAQESPVEILALPPLPWGFSLEDVAQLAENAARIVAELSHSNAAPAPNAGEILGQGLKAPLKALALAPCADDGLDFPLYAAKLPRELEPAPLASCEVCVAGLGAGGGMALLAAAERGCSTIGIEVNRELGGTHSAGRVCGFYNGYQGGANAKAVDDVKAAMAKVADGTPPGGLGYGALLLERAAALGAKLFTGSRVCGARLENGVLKGLLAANEDGLFSIAAEVAVDATGDADLAAFAGAKYAIGDKRDGMLQTYSMWGSDIYPAPSFLSMRYLRDPGLFHPDLYSERLRAVSQAHRGNSPCHISPMLTPRESRRIEGEASLTLKGILDQTVFPDAIAVALTRADSHAYTSSPLARLGVIASGKPLQTRIPYGCFIPKGIEGLLVGAKALSGERDATSFCRMNADIKNAGFALGAAASRAAKGRRGVRNIDLKALQEELKALGVLPDWAFAANEAPSVEALKNGSLPDLDFLLRAPEAEAKPLLERRFRELEAKGAAQLDWNSETALLSQALAWHGSELGGETVAALLERAVAEGRHRTPPHVKAFRTSFESGWEARNDFTLVNRLVVMAGLAQCDAVLAPLARIVAETPGFGEPIPKTMPYDEFRKDIVTEPFYHRLLNISFAAERKASASLAPAFERLFSVEGLAGYATPRASRETPQYMRAHLELCLARAAARCGSLAGAKSLASFLDDKHSFFRKHARQELVEIFGLDKGSPRAWLRWLGSKPAWSPKPFIGPKRLL